MAKQIVSFGLSQTDAVVMKWLEEHLIDPKEVAAYVIRRGNNDVPTIELTMIYDEEKAEQD